MSDKDKRTLKIGLIVVQCLLAGFDMLMGSSLMDEGILGIIAGIIFFAAAIVISPLISFLAFIGLLKGQSILRVVLQFVAAFVLFILALFIAPSSSQKTQPPETASVVERSSLTETTDTTEITTETADITTIESTEPMTSVDTTEESLVTSETTFPTEQETTTQQSTTPPPVATTQATTKATTQATTKTTTQAVVSQAQNYVLNWNTMKFHYPSCSSVSDIKDENRQDVHESKDTIKSWGFSPCRRCNP